MRLLVGAAWLFAVASISKALFTTPTVQGKVVGTAITTLLCALFVRTAMWMWARWKIEHSSCDRQSPVAGVDVE
ncbi:MAG: hypothetical protein M5T61_02190 [Acidimicrobiia bacterium]|nr:hypothetical protein [Acidimicrobiia bacterium]